MLEVEEAKAIDLRCDPSRTRSREQGEREQGETCKFTVISCLKPVIKDLEV